MLELIEELKPLIAVSQHLAKAAVKLEERTFHSGRLSAFNDLIDLLLEAEEREKKNDMGKEELI